MKIGEMSESNRTEAPDVFVMVPLHNHAKYIERCLRSIFAQTLHPIKLLVIDNGSTDDSAAVAERVLMDCPFPSELISHEDRGLCSSLNEGFAASYGKYFAYLGSDDIWFPRFLEQRVKLLEPRPNAVIGYGHANYIDENDQIYGSTTDPHGYGVDFVDGDVREMLVNVEVPISPSVFYRRSALESVSWNEDSILEDYEMYLKLMTIGEFAFDPEILAAWRKHSHNTSDNFISMHYEVLDAQRRHFASLGISEAEFQHRHTKMRFRHARIHLQHGEKGTALKLALGNWRGSRSRSELARFTMRLLIPMFLINAKRKYSKKRGNSIETLHSNPFKN
ncbi:MAG: glycosyltransferase family 2 protein [Chloracidobacterium sp.]|nr:glycosyltransferase family 2 protein [Chloracidobacterium sp.]